MNAPEEATEISELKDERLKIALEEWKLLEAKITRHAQFSFQTRGWLFTLLTALQLGSRAHPSKLSSGELIVGSILIIALFLMMEMVQRIAQFEAMRRASIVESAIRGQQKYDGPRISESMHLSVGPRSYLYAAANRIVMVPYLSLITIVVLLAFWSPPPG